MSYPESEEHPISQILTVDNRQLEIRRFGDNEKYVAFTFSKKDLPLQVFNGDPNNPMVVDQEDIDAI